MPHLTIKRSLTLLLLIVIAGCTSSSNNSQPNFNPDTGKHPANWITIHPERYIADPAQCKDCHGADLKGGITGVSCFSADFAGVSCHALGPAGHPANWALPTKHGAAAKGAPSRIPIAGFSVCQICHGSDFNGGGVGINCFACHGGTAPHPVSWITGTLTHTNTNTANAAVCALCHTAGANSPLPPPTPPAPGTPPGCFNSTLCHGAAGHPAGWSQPTQHGTHAKAASDPATMSGFSTCQSCHGPNFAGGIAITCLNTAGCHGAGVMSPHPLAWLPTSQFMHNTTDPGNAAVCALCHTAGANSPIPPPTPPAPGTPAGCFNSTLCHGAVGHPAGWEVPAQHGAHAKAAPNASTTSGFSVCQTCHGSNFQGGSSLQSCLNNAACHGAGVQSPHPAQWLPDNTLHHNTTNQANAPVCALCHRSLPGTPGCFNNTLCHGNPG
jgi:hypothetical protein